jgi:uncharacterized protein (TIGR03437 family)
MKFRLKISMRRFLALALGIAAVAAVTALVAPAGKVRAQQAGRLQIASISVGPDQTLTYPVGAPASPYLLDFPDEHTTIIPPASSSAPYLLFGASAISTAWGGTVALQSTDLQTFTFATGLGYSPQVMASPVAIGLCNPSYATEFDENYASQGFVGQDPTLPAGNMIMVYEAENHCVGGVNSTNGGLFSVGFTRSSDNGKTWPAPQNGPAGGTGRYPVLQSSEPAPANSQTSIGDLDETGFIDKSLDGNYYVYATYYSVGTTATDNGWRIARAALGQSHPNFLKWYNGSFSQPGIGGVDTQIMPTPCGGASFHSISYVDDLRLYLLTFVCETATTGAWYYSTATSLDLEDWTAPQMIANSQFPITTCSTGGPQFDGWYPSFMSPGAASYHLKLTGTVFYLQGCEVGQNSAASPRIFSSRTFTITAQPQAAPVLTSGSLANGATYISGGLVPGSWAQVKGAGMSNVTRIWAGFDFLNLGNLLPTSLSGVQVMVNNIPAAVYYVSPTQIDFQVPSGVSGSASVQVVVNGVASNSLSATASANSPGLFPNNVNGVNYPAAVFALSGGYPGDPTVPGYRAAAAFNQIELYATGLATEPGGVLPTAQAIDGVTVTIGNVTAPADYAGQTPYAGEFQINFTVPGAFATMPAGNYPISIAINGVSSPTTINSSPPGQIVLPITH